jgi:hypothetical protein
VLPLRLAPLRFCRGLLFPLALAASPLLLLVLLALVPAVVFRPFHRKEYGRLSMTPRGEVVKSRSEKAIADWLSRRGSGTPTNNTSSTRAGASRMRGEKETIVAAARRLMRTMYVTLKEEEPFRLDGCHPEPLRFLRKRERIGECPSSNVN